MQLTAPQIVEAKQLVPRVCLFAATSGNLTPNLDLCDISWRHDITGTINVQTPTATGTNPRAMHALTLSLRAASRANHYLVGGLCGQLRITAAYVPASGRVHGAHIPVERDDAQV